MITPKELTQFRDNLKTTLSTVTDYNELHALALKFRESDPIKPEDPDFYHCVMHVIFEINNINDDHDIDSTAIARLKTYLYTLNEEQLTYSMLERSQYPNWNLRESDPSYEAIDLWNLYRNLVASYFNQKLNSKSCENSKEAFNNHYYKLNTLPLTKEKFDEFWSSTPKKMLTFVEELTAGDNVCYLLNDALIDHVDELYEVDGGLESYLSLCIRYSSDKHLRSVLRILPNLTDLTTKNNYGKADNKKTLLHCAIERRPLNPELIDTLLKQNVKPETTAQYRREEGYIKANPTALGLLARVDITKEKNREPLLTILKSFIDNAEVPPQDKFHDFTFCMSELVNQIIRSNSNDPESSFCENGVTFIQKLVSHGACFNLKQIEWHNLLSKDHDASLLEALGLTKLNSQLLKEITYQTPEGERHNLLFRAIYLHNIPAMNAFLELGFNPNSTNSKQMNAIDYVISTGTDAAEDEYILGRLALYSADQNHLTTRLVDLKYSRGLAREIAEIHETEIDDLDKQNHDLLETIQDLRQQLLALQHKVHEQQQQIHQLEAEKDGFVDVGPHFFQRR